MENGFVWPTSILPSLPGRTKSNQSLNGGDQNKNKSNHQHNNNNSNHHHPDEPIYSEPLPPMSSQVREAERTVLKFYPDPTDPVQISNHIYEYLVTRRSDASTQSGKKNNKNKDYKSHSNNSINHMGNDSDYMRSRSTALKVFQMAMPVAVTTSNGGGRRRGSVASSSSPSSAGSSNSTMKDKPASAASSAESQDYSGKTDCA